MGFLIRTRDDDLLLIMGMYANVQRVLRTQSPPTGSTCMSLDSRAYDYYFIWSSRLYETTGRVSDTVRSTT